MPPCLSGEKFMGENPSGIQSPAVPFQCRFWRHRNHHCCSVRIASFPIMKTMTVAPWFALILVCEAALGQGLGLVNLNNNFTPQGGTAKAFILGLDRLPMPKALGSVEILDSTGHVIRSGGLATAGIFAFGIVGIPGTVPGGNGEIRIRMWDNSTGTSYESATVKGSTVVSLAGLGGAEFPIPSLGTISNFWGLEPCPFCPLWWDTSSQIYVITPVGDQLRVLASGNYSISWALWTSTNLVDWIPAGATQRSEGAPWLTAYFEWMIPQPPSPTLYRVIQVEN